MNDGALSWIIGSGLLMSAISLMGGLALLLPERMLEKLLLPLVAFAAGTLLGGAFFHMIPSAVEHSGNDLTPYVWVLAGFAVFFAVEQFLHWHHCERSNAPCRKPLTYLILIGDAVHNFVGGLAVAGAFISDIRLGITAWLAAAAHEIPQELGDFGVLLHGGWSKKGALLYNFLSATTFLLGGLCTYALSFHIDLELLIPFAAGNFLYIGAADLVPEVNRHTDLRLHIVHFASFLLGLGVLLAIRLLSLG